MAGGWNAACQSLVKWYIPGQIVQTAAPQALTERRAPIRSHPEITDLTELLKGEEAYVLGYREEVAQGSYREWVQEKVTEKYINTSGSVGLGKVRLARGMSQLTLWASLVKKLFF